MNVSSGRGVEVRETVAASTGRAYVWRCARCGRFLARIDRLDGVLEEYQKCGAMNRLAGIVDDEEDEPNDLA